MSNLISTASVEQYKSNVRILAQQKISRLRRTCREDGEMVGRSVYFDRIGATAAVRNTVRHADTPLVNSQHSRRQAVLVDYDWADLIDSQDRVRMLWDPSSPYARNAGHAMGRAIDDEIILAMDADVNTGMTGSGSSSFPASQDVALAYATNEWLSVEKLIRAREILDESEVDPDAQRFIVVTAAMLSQLLNITEVTSADYNTVKALVSGQLDTYMGFQFIRSERLPLSGTNGTSKYAFAYTSDALGFEAAKDMMVDIGPRRDKRNATQVYVCQSLTAVRIEDEQIVRIDVTPDATVT